MSERIRTILAVTVLTIVIWVWADLEQTAPPREVQVPVKVLVPQDYRVRSISPREVTVKFQGPKGEVEKLTAAPDQLVCRLELSEQELKGQELSKPLSLHATDGFRDWTGRRVVVLDVKAEHDGHADGDVDVGVDRLVNVEIPVQARVTQKQAANIRADPSVVTARVTEADSKRLLAAGAATKPYAVAELDGANLPPDSQVDEPVALDLRLGGIDHVTADSFMPKNVRVTATLKSALITKPLRRIPIHIARLPDSLSRYKIVFQKGTEMAVDLVVQGPAPDIDRLDPADIYVVLDLAADETPVTGVAWVPGKLKVLGLPPYVTLVEAAADGQLQP